VGYTGGKQPNPTYRNIKDATESIMIEYDPDLIDYTDLIIEWSQMHTPSRPKANRQYRSVIFYGNTEEKKIAVDALRNLKSQLNVRTIYTDIEPWSSFYRAEEYHQDYYKKAGMK